MPSCGVQCSVHLTSVFMVHICKWLKSTIRVNTVLPSQDAHLSSDYQNMYFDNEFWLGECEHMSEMFNCKHTKVVQIRFLFSHSYKTNVIWVTCRPHMWIIPLQAGSVTCVTHVYHRCHIKTLYHTFLVCILSMAHEILFHFISFKFHLRFWKIEILFVLLQRKFLCLFVMCVIF